MKQSIILKEEDCVVIEFEGHQENIAVCGNGKIAFDMVTHGTEQNIFNENATGGWTSGKTANLNEIGQYLNLLYDALKVGHKVNTEIDEALARFKQEAGI